MSCDAVDARRVAPARRGRGTASAPASVENLVHQRGLARCRSRRSRRRTCRAECDVHVLQVVARGRRELIPARAARDAALGGSTMRRSPRRYAPVSDASMPASRWPPTVPPACPGRSARRRARRRPDRGRRRSRRCGSSLRRARRRRPCCPVAQAAERREQRAVVPLVQADRRLVEHVKDAGQVRRRSASPGGCAGLRLRRASRRCAPSVR